MKLASVIILTGLLPLNYVFAVPSSDDKSAQYNADNTGKNQRDVKAEELTAQDQSNSKQEVEVTRSIRKAIVDDKNLSTSAHNIKIIVADNTVTLKGPVKSSQEMKLVLAKAKTAAPNIEILNQIKVIQ